MGIFNKFLIYCYFLDGICWFFLLREINWFCLFYDKGIMFFYKEIFFFIKWRNINVWLKNIVFIIKVMLVFFFYDKWIYFLN